jgi:hypothetical protein
MNYIFSILLSLLSLLVLLYQTHQNHYANNLKCIDVTSVDTIRPQTPLNEEQHKDYMSLLGGVAWLNLTRMDICIYVQALQRAASKPTVGHLMRLNTVTRWIDNDTTQELSVL